MPCSRTGSNQEATDRIAHDTRAFREREEKRQEILELDRRRERQKKAFVALVMAAMTGGAAGLIAIWA
jgi:predicted nucleic acid-binding Zn ribbon protein